MQSDLVMKNQGYECCVLSRYSVTWLVVFSLALSFNLTAQEVQTKWDAGLPQVQQEEKSSQSVEKPAPIDFKVLSSTTTRVPLRKLAGSKDMAAAPEFYNITVRMVEAPDLPEVAKPNPKLNEELGVEGEATEALTDFKNEIYSTSLVILSATVHKQNDQVRSLVKISSMGDEVTAWSNIDFNHFTGVSGYQVKDGVDGSVYDFALVMAIGNESEEQSVKIPKLPNFNNGAPAFIVVDGEKNKAAMDALEQIHDLYRKEGARMKTDFLVREKSRLKQEAFLRANPPKPKDVIVNFWKREDADK